MQAGERARIDREVRIEVQKEAHEHWWQQLYWSTIIAVIALILSIGAAVSLERVAVNTTTISHDQRAIRTVARYECDRVEDLRARFDHNSRVAYAALTQIASVMKRGGERFTAAQLLALGDTLGVENSVDCRHPDGLPPFHLLGPKRPSRSASSRR